MTNQNRINLQVVALVLSLLLGAGSAVGLIYTAMSYPYRLEQLERVTIPEIRAAQKEMRAEMAQDRSEARAQREILIRIDERLAEVQRRLER
jgi:hypothetical protein